MPTAANLAKIHIAKKELQLTDETYRDMLHLHFQVKSAKQLTDRQCAVMLNHLKAKGWQPKSPAVVKEGRKNTTRANDNYRRIPSGPAARQQRYVLALWAKLGYEIKKLDSRCHQQFGIDRFEWVTEHDQLRVLITDLRKRCQDAGLDPDGAKE